MQPNFDQMSLGELEEIVGKKASAVEVLGRWVVATFSGGITGTGALAADRRRVMFRNW